MGFVVISSTLQQVQLAFGCVKYVCEKALALEMPQKTTQIVSDLPSNHHAAQQLTCLVMLAAFFLNWLLIYLKLVSSDFSEMIVQGHDANY